MHSRGLFCISLFQLFDENEFTLALLSPISVCKTLQINQFVVIIRLWVLPKFFIFFWRSVHCLVAPEIKINTQFHTNQIK